METQTIQISAGRGPAECELAVGLYLEYLKRSHSGCVVIKEESPWSTRINGRNYKGCKSVVLEVPTTEDMTLGVIKWICPSPLRPKEDRKNWFIEIQALEAAETGPAHALIDPDNPDKRLIRFETFHSSGPGGQNVNKVESGVRVIHMPSGLSAASTAARSQWQNRRLALKLLADKLKSLENQAEAELADARRKRHDMLERGNAIAVFEGLNFRKR